MNEDKIRAFQNKWERRHQKAVNGKFCTAPDFVFSHEEMKALPEKRDFVLECVGENLLAFDSNGHQVSKFGEVL